MNLQWDKEYVKSDFSMMKPSSSIHSIALLMLNNNNKEWSTECSLEGRMERVCLFFGFSGFFFFNFRVIKKLLLAMLSEGKEN